MKTQIAITLFITATIILFFGTCAYADLKTLIEIGKNQADIAKSLNKETENYNKVKEAITSGELKEGMAAGEIQKKYGEPVINIFDKKKNAYKWLYMPATSTHFKGEKLYLFVDKEDRLVGWQIIEE